MPIEGNKIILISSLPVMFFHPGGHQTCMCFDQKSVSFGCCQEEAKPQEEKLNKYLMIMKNVNVILMFL